MGKKGSSNTTVQSYTPTDQEVRLQKQAADYSEAVAPNALKLNNIAGDLLYGSYGTVQADYDKMNRNAQQQMLAAQSGVGNLTNGVLPQAYLDNMANAVSGAINKTVGTTVNDLGQRGVLNSSVTTKALNDASANAANAVTNSYLQNINALSGLYGQQAGLASQPIAISAAAQEAAQQPAVRLWDASLGLNGSTLGALSGVAGKGTTTSTQTSSGGGGLFGGLLSAAARFI